MSGISADSHKFALYQKEEKSVVFLAGWVGSSEAR